MQNTLARIYRHEPPTKQDTAPYGTECKVECGKYFEMYLQLSNDEEDPRWVCIAEYGHGIPEEIIQSDINQFLNPS